VNTSEACSLRLVLINTHAFDIKYCLTVAEASNDRRQSAHDSITKVSFT